MEFKVCFLLCFAVVVCNALPTMYRYNENRVLEPDMVPVSSTVIPLPIYKVTSGLNVESSKLEKIKKTDGPVNLVTFDNKKKTIPTPKPKPSNLNTSSVKEISKEDFEN